MSCKYAFIGAMALACVFSISAKADENVAQYFAANTPAISASHAVVGKPMQLSGGNLLDEARKYVGSGKITRLPGSWCRDFINLVAQRAGVPLANKSRLAIDASRLGPHVSTPRPGDLVVFRHHVTIYAGREGNKIVGLGGNQSKRVRYSNYDPRHVIAFVRI